jgi:hypothetical protein
MANDAELVSDEEMLHDFKLALHQNVKAGKIGGIALVQGLKAIQALIPPPPSDEADKGEPFSVIDQLDSLPRNEGQRLLRQEITRLREQVAAYEDALIATAD